MTITLTTVHITYDPGFMAPILTECVRAHSAMGEFLNKFPDRKNVTFEETDGGLDRSHESLGASFNTKDTVDDCVLYCGDWNWLQRHRYGVHVWLDGAQEEDQVEYDIAPRKGTVPHAVRGVHASLQELSYLRMILKNGMTSITALETTIQGKGDSRQPEFPNLVGSLKEKNLVGDHASTRAAETFLAKESSAQDGKRSSTWDIDIWLKRWTRTNEHLGWNSN